MLVSTNELLLVKIASSEVSLSEAVLVSSSVVSVFVTSSPFSEIVSVAFESSVLAVLSPVIALFNPQDVKDKHKAKVQLKINSFLF